MIVAQTLLYSCKPTRCYCSNNIVNIGYDASKRKGLLHAFKFGASSVITLDADGQHNSADFSKLFSFLETTDTELLLVHEILTHASWIAISFLTQRLFGLSDITSGLNSIAGRFLRTAFRYAITTQLALVFFSMPFELVIL